MCAPMKWWGDLGNQQVLGLELLIRASLVQMQKRMCWRSVGSREASLTASLRDVILLPACLLTKAKPCRDASVHLQLGEQRRTWAVVGISAPGLCILRCWSLISIVDFCPFSYLPSGRAFVSSYFHWELKNLIFSMVNFYFSAPLCLVSLAQGLFKRSRKCASA